MADDMIQKTEGRGQKTDACAPLCGTFVKVAAAPRQHPCLLFSALCLLVPAFCCAEELPDPTRPPASLATLGAAVGVGPAPTGLQSIIISKDRRAAIIDGETVELGGKHGDAKLIAVNEGAVVLQGAKGRQVLTLFPDVKMTTVKVTGKQDMEEKPQSPESRAQPEKQKAKQAARKGIN